MKRASTACFSKIRHTYGQENQFDIFCGKGNNGGDGLALALLLLTHGFQKVKIFIVRHKTYSPEFQFYFNELKNTGAIIEFISKDTRLPDVSSSIVIDALLGIGLNKTIEGIYEKIIFHLNNQSKITLSIDVPSGLFIDKPSLNENIIQAQKTYTFQAMKLAFLMPENYRFTGEVEILNIGLSSNFEIHNSTTYKWIDDQVIENIYRKRSPFSNKGDYGYACLIAGSEGMMGAAQLASIACLRSGVGKMSVGIPSLGYTILQSTVPEAMCFIAGEKYPEYLSDLSSFSSIGIGPGIGQYKSHEILLTELFLKFNKPVVLDADALNTLAAHPELFKYIPPHSILTPHPKEFERLFGKQPNSFERIQKALEQSRKWNIYILIKGRYTFIATPEGIGYFNSTGNAGMATAGSGDVLTGVLTGLLAQKYTTLEACLLGVFVHGRAGDLAAKCLSQEALIARDIIQYLGKSFLSISNQ